MHGSKWPINSARIVGTEKVGADLLVESMSEDEIDMLQGVGTVFRSQVSLDFFHAPCALWSCDW